MDGIQIGYARVSTTGQDLTAQRDALLKLGVEDAHIYVDHGMTGTNRVRPGLREATAVDLETRFRRGVANLFPADARWSSSKAE